MTLPTQEMNAGVPSYVHAHVHTGTTSPTVFASRPSALVVLAAAGTVTCRTAAGAIVLGPTSVGIVLPLTVNDVELSNAADAVLFLW